MIELAGKMLPRLAASAQPFGKLQQRLLNEFIAQVLRPPSGSPIEGWRSAATARRAAAAPPVCGPDGKPASLGRLAICRIGGANEPPSPAFLFRLARHAETTVIAYANPMDPTKNVLRPVAAVGSVPVPPELQNRIFAIGDADNRFIFSYLRSSDNFIEQLAQIHRQKELLGVDPLTAGAVVVAHSNGAADAVLTRERLEAAGFPNAIRKLVAISGIFCGVPRSYIAVLKALVAWLQAIGAASDVFGELDMLDAAETQKHFPPDKERFVDLSVAGVLGPEGSAVRPLMRLAGAGSEVLDRLLFSSRDDGRSLRQVLSDATDGLAPTKSSRYGRCFVLLDKPYDHGGTMEDPAVIDFIVGILSKSS